MEPTPPSSTGADAGGPGAGIPAASSRQWAMLSHLLSLLGYLIALGHFVPPLVIWLSKRDEDEFVADQSKESLNFQITFLIAYVVAGVLLVALTLTVCLAPLGWLIAAGVSVAHLVLVIVAGIKASDGVRYRYPVTIRFL